MLEVDVPALSITEDAYTDLIGGAEYLVQQYVRTGEETYLDMAFEDATYAVSMRMERDRKLAEVLKGLIGVE